MQNQNQSRLGHTRFPALGAGYVYLFWVLVGSLCCLCLLWLVIVIASVLVLRHSNKYKQSHSTLLIKWHHWLPCMYMYFIFCLTVERMCLTCCFQSWIGCFSLCWSLGCENSDVNHTKKINSSRILLPRVKMSYPVGGTSAVLANLCGIKYSLKEFLNLFIQSETSASTHKAITPAANTSCCLATLGMNTAGSVASRRRDFVINCYLFPQLYSLWFYHQKVIWWQ